MKRPFIVLLILAMLMPALAEAPQALEDVYEIPEAVEIPAGEDVPIDAESIAETTPQGESVCDAPVIEDAIAPALIEAEASEAITGNTASMNLIVGEKTLTLGLNEKYTIPVSFADGGTYETSFASANAKIAKVDQNGVITCVKTGKTTVRVISGEDFADIAVTVKKAPSKLTLSAKTCTLGIGETLKFAYKLSSGSAGSVSWNSGNANVFTVAADGTITAVGEGCAKLTAATYNGKKATASVKVCAAPTALTIDESRSLGVGQKAALTATLSEGSAGALTWASSDPEIVAVDANGQLTAVAVGQAIVTATAYNGLSAGCAVTVRRAPEKLLMFCKTITLGVGETIAAPVVCDPDCEPGLTYASSAKKYVRVTADGTITAVKKGTAVITAKTYNGKKAKVTVKVVKGSTALALSPETLSLDVGEAKQLTLSGSASSVVSADPGIATVSGSGVVKGVSAGETEIIAYGACGRTSVCRVTVGGEAQIRLDTDALEMGAGQTAVIGYRKVGGECTAISSDPKIATVKADGTVTALKAGICVIRFSITASVYADCRVTVKAAPTAIALSDMTLTVGDVITPEVSVKPAGAYTGGFTFTSSNANVVRAESDGTLCAVAAGSATIAVKSYNGVKTAAKVKVVAAHTAVCVSPETVVMQLGETVALNVTYEDSSACAFVLSSSNTDTVKLLSDGATLYGAGIGSATVTVTAENGLTASIEVSVTASDDLFIVAPASVSLLPKETVSLTVTVTRFSGEAVKWESSDTNIAKVSAAGLVTAVNAGTCVITVTSENGFTARCEVTVSKMIMDLSHYNTVTDFDALARNVSFVILRATCGTATDNKFTQFATELNKRGVPFGVYCYGKAQSVSDAKNEATLLYNTAKAYNPKFYTYDAETDYLTAGYITAFAKQLRALGASRVGCYVAHHKYTAYGFASIASWFDFVWIPRYGKNDGTLASSIKPNYTCDLWQYTSTAKFDFISGSVDLNKVTGTGKSLSWFMGD